MQRRTFNLLLTGAAVSAAAAGVSIATGNRGLSQPPPAGRAVPGLADKLGDVARMRISRGAMTINFTVMSGHWGVVEKGNYPAAEERVRKLLVGLAELELVEPKSDRAELLPRLDLDDPASGKSTLVAVQDKSGASLGELIIGRRRPSSLDANPGGDAGLYVRKGNTDQAWLARGSVDVSGDLLAWLDRRIVDLPAERVATIVLTGPDGAAVVLTRTAPDAAFMVEGSPNAPDPKTVATLAGALTALDLDDVEPAAKQAIPVEGAATAAFTGFDGVIVGARLSPPGAADRVALDATGSGDAAAKAAALSAKLARWSYRIPAERAKLLRTTLADLQPRGS
jgi:hypothetical protein